MPKLTKHSKYTKHDKSVIEEIEELYIKDWVNDWTLPALADKFGISHSALRDWSIKFGWVEKKKRVRGEMWEEFQKKQFNGEGLDSGEKLKEIMKMRSENAYESARDAIRMRHMLRAWMMEHDKYQRDQQGNIMVDEFDRPLENDNKATVKEIESACSINQKIYETLFLTLGPDIKPDMEFKINWAIPIDESLKQMTFEELEEHERLLVELKEEYKKGLKNE